jgi:hypothetical protein
MMEEQNDKFAAKGSAPVKGYLKVETGNNKGAMRCAVQNLNYYPKRDYVYKLILFGKKGEKTIHTIIGNLLVNRQGNGETYFRFQPLDIDGKGNPYHYFSTAIIAAASTVDPNESLHPVLKGVIFEENRPFQGELSEMNSEEDEEEETEEVIHDEKKKDEELVAAEPKVAGEEETETDMTPQPEQVASDSEEIDSQLGQVAYDAEEIDAQPDQVASDVEEIDAEPEQSAAPEKEGPRAATEDRRIEKKVYNDFYNRYILNACAHTCRVAEYHEDVMPFSKDRTGARWKRMVNVANLPLVSPGAHYFATQYRHYIFGAKADENGVAIKYYFGIPGRFLPEEQPDGGHSGFTFWQPIIGAEDLVEGAGNNIKNRRSAYGYWIVAVDAKTGNIEEV